MHRLNIALLTTLKKEFIYIKILDRHFLICNLCAKVVDFVETMENMDTI